MTADPVKGFRATPPNKSEHVRTRGAAYGLPVTVPETGPAEPSATPTSYLERVDPDELATTLKVLSELHLLAPDHPDVRTVKHATGHMWKLIKKTRRAALRAERAAHDRAVVERTATGSALRIDDETAGLPLVSTAQGAYAGELITARGCYICKTDYTLVDAFYHGLCPDCAAFSHSKRDQRTDLTTITTRFPKDAVRRFAAMEDSAEWLHRLTVVGIDLRDPTQVVALTDDVAAAGPLDILINNACQTVRRSPGAYSQLVEMESAPLPDLPVLPEMVSFDRISEAHPAAITGALREHSVAHHEGESAEQAQAAHNAASLTALALKAGHASLDAHLAGTAVDAGGLLPDLQTTNSWTQVVDEVDPLELLEVQFCNAIAPFLLVSRLRPAMRAAIARGARRAYVVNVSAMEGQFGGRRYKGAGHPHTNMAKASLNMLTRTSATEMFETDRILMTSVDTGWITDERPHQEKLRIAAEGWHAPLDLVDGAARVYDPIVRGEAGEDLFGCFLKDYVKAPW